MRSVIALVLVARTAAAEPPTARCEASAYLEPSVLFGIDRTTVLDRIALGALIRDCTASHEASTSVRLGVTAYLSDIGGAGVGVELEVDRPISSDWRAGLRVGAESANNGGGLFTFGARFHVSDVASLQVDAYHVTGYGRATGAMVGIGFEGRAGAGIAAAELSAGAVLVLLLLNALAHERT